MNRGIFLYSFLVVLFLSQLAARGDRPELIASDQLDSLILTVYGVNSGAVLYWKTDCGGDFSPARSRIRSLAVGQPVAGAVLDSTADAIAQTLYYPAECTAHTRIASANVAVDIQYVYWMNGEGSIMRLGRDANYPGSVPVVIAPSSLGRPRAADCYLAVDDRYIYWSEGTRIARASKAPSASVETIFSSPNQITKLTMASDGQLLYLDANRLMLLASSGTVFLPITVADAVHDYAVSPDGTRVYWGTEGIGDYSIESNSLPRLNERRLHFRTTPVERTAHPQQHVGSITADRSNLYWNVLVDVTGGPILRLPIDLLRQRQPSVISEQNLLGGQRLFSDGSYLYWAKPVAGRAGIPDESAGIYRLPVTALNVPTVTAARPILSLTDVSPDEPFAPTNTGMNTAGKVRTVVVDPLHPQELYVASEYAGVWKSTDEARSWFQSSRGLRTGWSAGSPNVLAIDDTTRGPSGEARLIYATAASDFRPGSPFGGLWVSLDSGNHWEHRGLGVDPAHPDNGSEVDSVYFGLGRAFARTPNGLFTSLDLTTWTLLPVRERI